MSKKANNKISKKSDSSTNKEKNRDTISKRGKRNQKSEHAHPVPRVSQIPRISQIEIDQEKKDQQAFIFPIRKRTEKEKRRVQRVQHTSKNRLLEREDQFLAQDWVVYIEKLELPTLQYIFDSWARVQSKIDGIRVVDRYDALDIEIEEFRVQSLDPRKDEHADISSAPEVAVDPLRIVVLRAILSILYCNHLFDTHELRKQSVVGVNPLTARQRAVIETKAAQKTRLVDSAESGTGGDESNDDDHEDVEGAAKSEPEPALAKPANHLKWIVLYLKEKLGLDDGTAHDLKRVNGWWHYSIRECISHYGETDPDNVAVWIHFLRERGNWPREDEEVPSDEQTDSDEEKAVENIVDTDVVFIEQGHPPAVDSRAAARAAEAAIFELECANKYRAARADAAEALQQAIDEGKLSPPEPIRNNGDHESPTSPLGPSYTKELVDLEHELRRRATLLQDQVDMERRHRQAAQEQQQFDELQARAAAIRSMNHQQAQEHIEEQRGLLAIRLKQAPPAAASVAERAALLAAHPVPGGRQQAAPANAEPRHAAAQPRHHAAPFATGRQAQQLAAPVEVPRPRRDEFQSQLEQAIELSRSGVQVHHKDTHRWKTLAQHTGERAQFEYERRAIRYEEDEEPYAGTDGIWDELLCQEKLIADQRRLHSKMLEAKAMHGMWARFRAEPAYIKNTYRQALALISHGIEPCLEMRVAYESFIAGWTCPMTGRAADASASAITRSNDEQPRGRGYENCYGSTGSRSPDSPSMPPLRQIYPPRVDIEARRNQAVREMFAPPDFDDDDIEDTEQEKAEAARHKRDRFGGAGDDQHHADRVREADNLSRPRFTTMGRAAAALLQSGAAAAQMQQQVYLDDIVNGDGRLVDIVGRRGAAAAAGSAAAARDDATYNRVVPAAAAAPAVTITAAAPAAAGTRGSEFETDPTLALSTQKAAYIGPVSFGAGRHEHDWDNRTRAKLRAKYIEVLATPYYANALGGGYAKKLELLLDANAQKMFKLQWEICKRADKSLELLPHISTLNAEDFFERILRTFGLSDVPAVRTHTSIIEIYKKNLERHARDFNKPVHMAGLTLATEKTMQAFGREREFMLPRTSRFACHDALGLTVDVSNPTFEQSEELRGMRKAVTAHCDRERTSFNRRCVQELDSMTKGMTPMETVFTLAVAVKRAEDGHESIQEWGLSGNNSHSSRSKRSSELTDSEDDRAVRRDSWKDKKRVKQEDRERSRSRSNSQGRDRPKVGFDDTVSDSDHKRRDSGRRRDSDRRDSAGGGSESDRRSSAGGRDRSRSSDRGNNRRDSAGGRADRSNSRDRDRRHEDDKNMAKYKPQTEDTRPSCYVCGRRHPGACHLAKHPNANHSGKPWAQSEMGKAWAVKHPPRLTLPHNVTLDNKSFESGMHAGAPWADRSNAPPGNSGGSGHRDGRRGEN